MTSLIPLMLIRFPMQFQPEGLPRTQGKDVCNEIYQSGKLEESTEQNLRTALEDWKRTFA